MQIGTDSSFDPHRSLRDLGHAILTAYDSLSMTVASRRHRAKGIEQTNRLYLSTLLPQTSFLGSETALPNHEFYLTIEIP